MSVEQIILLVAGILGANLVLWIVIIAWVRRATRARAATLRAELDGSGERLVLGPEPAIYRGATAGRTKVKGNGIIALTDRRLLFDKLIGDRVEVSRAEIVGVRVDRWFLRSARGGKLHLIVKLQSGEEVGYIVRDHEAWVAALQPAA
ncbi:MAG: hypothetical protein R3A51_05230 [Nannocystaceae bacterium]